MKAEEKTDQHLNPLKVLHIAEEVMSDDTVMVADGGDFVATAAYILRSVYVVITCRHHCGMFTSM